MIIGEYNKSVILTYIGTTFAIFGMFYAIHQQLSTAMICMVVCGICDLFDGKVAAMFKRTEAQKKFGIEIDSLCDMINFAAFPAIFVLSQSNRSIYTIVISVIYVLAAVTRLAHFNRLTKGISQPSSYFIGLPVTYSALVFPILYLISQWFFPSLFVNINLIAMLLLAFLYIWNHAIPKPNLKAYYFFVALAIFTLIGLWSL